VRPTPYPRRPHRAVLGNNLQCGDGFIRPTTNRPGGYTDPYYTTNLCSNPSFETSMAGWTGTDPGTALSQNTLIALYGGTSLNVTTDGSVPGQGVFGPGATFPSYAGTGSMTISVNGQSGSLNITAVANPGGQVLASTVLVLTGAGWQTVVLDGLPFGSFEQLYILVTTVSSQAVSFNIDGVMYEPESPAHPYCDGDQVGCYWTGTAELSSSYQPNQFDFSSVVSIRLAGFLSVIQPGENFPIPEPFLLEFYVDPYAASATVGSPQAALTDFGIWELTDPDPAMTYGWWTNSGVLSGQLGYSQPYAMVVPPLDYPVSGGAFAWRRAAYAAVGFEWASVPNSVQQILTDIQLEYCRTSVGSAVTPSTYQHPRQLQVIISPDRLNYLTNPAFQNGTVNWSGIGGGETLAKDTTKYPGNISTYDNLPYGAFQSGKISLNSGTDSGAKISVPYLIPGYVYTCSMYVLPGTQVADIIASCEGASADIAGLVLPQYAYGGLGTEGYGQGPYGGIQASNTALPQNWVRVSFTFTATSDTGLLEVVCDPVTSPSYPVSFWVTAVLCEQGDILLSYFDGNSGVDAIWETGGTAGQARSYYYTQYEFGQGIVTQALAANTPLGISYATPLYGTPPTQ